MTSNDQMRKAVDNCGMSRYELARVSGVTQAALSRFIHGQRGMTLDMFDRLAPHVGAKLVFPRRTRGKQ